MRFFPSLALTASCIIPNALSAIIPSRMVERGAVVCPKVVIISMFGPEGDVWYGIPEFDLTALNVTVGGLSPVYGKQVGCTANGDICQITIGEAEINAATTITALVRSTKFDFTSTYFMVGGIAGINPQFGGTGSVTFARYAVQVALQYEFGGPDIPANYTFPYVPFGEYAPFEYPSSIYGTEVFEFNKDLQHVAAELARTAKLNDTAIAKSFRHNYASTAAYAAGAADPGVYECDVATSDVWFTGAYLSEGFFHYTKLLTNGSGNYCTTAQEDNATAEALLRAALDKLVDFSRVIVMRTASDYDRPFKGEEAITNLLYAVTDAFEPSIMNIYLAGVKVVEGIVNEWEGTFEKGIKPSNYIGDILGSLGGTQDFGPYVPPGDDPLKHRKRGAKAARLMRKA